MAGRPLTTPDVGQQATDFAQRIETLLQNVLGGNDDGYVAEPEGMSLRAGRTGYRITQRDARGVSLNSDGEKVAGLSFRFHCSCRNENSWLQIDKSVIMVTAEPEHVPLFHYDYNRGRTSETPGAHVNIFGSNDAATRIMLSCGKGLRSKSRRRKYINDGAFPTFSTLHFPVGGDRFRPGLEDVLQMTVYEFHIDVTDDWEKHLNQSRAEYRERQLKALVREYPDLAWDALTEGGADLAERPKRPHRSDRPEVLVKY